MTAMKVPQDRRYSKDHEWVKLDGKSATVGITEFAQSELGDIVFIDLPATGKVVQKGGTVCVVESTKAASDVYSPVSGTVVKVNSALADTPAKINEEPYEAGWMVTLELSDSGEYEALMDGEAYEKFLSSK